MNNQYILVLAVFVSGMLIGLAFFVDAYYKFKKSTTIALKVAKQSPQWKKINQILTNDFSYYQGLPEHLKEDFIYRTYQFMRLRQWISSASPVVELQRKVLISASAIQLTFGLKNFSFGRFRTILVHNDAYYNRLTKQYHRGEVNPKGLIVLSWKYFEKGYSNGRDKINLGLHEMAHALNLAIVLSDGRQYQLHRLMEKFELSAFEEITKIRTGENSFFRTYGSTNTKEFFSVAVEHFFEAPEEFNQKLPELYMELCQLLNQDPANKVFRGYKSPHSNLYNNQITPSNLVHTKPIIKLVPNLNLIIPFVSISVLVALCIPVINVFINAWPWMLIIGLCLIYLGTLYLVYYYKAKQLLIVDNHLYTTNYLLHNDKFSVHLKNIININFTYMLTHYQTSISFFEGEQICDKKILMYYSPAHIKKLERFLLQQSIKIKHNNRWLKKDSF